MHNILIVFILIIKTIVKLQIDDILLISCVSERKRNIFRHVESDMFDINHLSNY